MFIISAKLFSVNEKSLRASGFLPIPAGVVMIRYSVYNLRQKSRLFQTECEALRQDENNKEGSSFPSNVNNLPI
jgi:hypothetical protein